MNPYVLWSKHWKFQGPQALEPTIHPPKDVPHAKTQGASVDALTNASIEAGDGPKALTILDYIVECCHSWE